VEALSPFYPDRMASRILGMGDVVTMVEKAQAVVDEKEAARLAQKMVSVSQFVPGTRVHVPHVSQGVACEREVCQKMVSASQFVPGTRVHVPHVSQ
jgi:hypothetical protein